jgi:DNA-damage-inducible protein J
VRYIVAQRRFHHDRQFCRARADDEQIKKEAAAVLEAMGLTVSDAFRMMMVKIAKEKALPFEPLVPNEETIAAMKAARRGELTTVGPPGKLLTSLGFQRQVEPEGRKSRPGRSR